VLSPHLDDAVLSCGGLLLALAGRSSVTVATVFTEAGPRPHTRAARSFLSTCGGSDAASLYAERRAEDREVLARLRAEAVHLGLVDALFRRSPRRVAGLGRVASALPELVHRYPTYRFDIARGRVAPGDRGLAAEVGPRIAELVRSTGAEVVLCPVGVGRHVDHLLVRALGAAHPREVVYYSDFPYDRRAAPDAAFLARHRLVAHPWEEGVADKAALIRGYRTQADALFPDGIPAAPEVYFVPER
jgi:LmbE family N-acetylglucosaminyl deacetylase